MSDSQRETVSVVIVSWNSAEALRRNLPHVARLRDAFDVDLAIVDNASGDGSAGVARELAPWAKVEASGTNAGFAAGCARGTALTTAPWILFLNPDARIEAASLTILIEALKKKKVHALAGPALFDEQGRFYNSSHKDPSSLNYWVLYSVFAPAFRRLASMGKSPRAAGSEPSRNVDPAAKRTHWLMGACVLARRSAFERVGGFPEAYHLYAEDAELGWNLRQAGFDVLYVPAAQATHEHGHSSRQAPDSRERLFESLLLYGRRVRDAKWLGEMGRLVRADMRLRLLLRGVARLARPGLDSGGERAGAWRRILEMWRPERLQ